MCVQCKDFRQAVKEGQLLTGSSLLGEMDYIIHKKCEEKSVKMDSCKFPHEHCSYMDFLIYNVNIAPVSMCWKMLMKYFYLFQLSCGK